jgi:hypothetical protein
MGARKRVQSTFGWVKGVIYLCVCGTLYARLVRLCISSSRSRPTSNTSSLASGIAISYALSMYNATNAPLTSSSWTMSTWFSAIAICNAASLSRPSPSSASRLMFEFSLYLLQVTNCYSIKECLTLSTFSSPNRARHFRAHLLENVNNSTECEQK